MLKGSIMGNTNSPAENGHAAGKQNGQELGLLNELRLLDCIKTQGWVRETEAAVICGMSSYMVGQVGRRLATRGEIYRDRPHGNAGFFLRLKAAGADRVDGKSGKDVTIPHSWRHDALAVQVLGYLSGIHGCSFETEAEIRHSCISGKIADGLLINNGESFPIEQEFSRKSGAHMRKQTLEIARLAATGKLCFISYPYPPECSNRVDHETRLINAFHAISGNVTYQNIKLVRCNFDTHLAFLNMQPSHFEIVAFPISDLQDSTVPTERHFHLLHWEIREIQHSGVPLKIQASLLRDGEEIVKCEFFEENSEGTAHHMLSNSYGTEYCQDKSMSFVDFVRMQQQIIIENEEGELRMLAMSR